jgi:elongation factor G
MAEFGVNKLRNVALLSHSGAGKTMIAEAMMFAAGQTSRKGNTAAGTTVSDYEPEEIKRTASVQTSVVPIKSGGHKLNLLDTPGFADFRGDVVSALRVADAVVEVISAHSVVEVGTVQTWEMAKEAGLPRLIFVNKMDRENADFDRTMDSIMAAFGRECVPVNVPIGAEASFSGVHDVLSANPPAEVGDRVASAYERLVEAVAESDDDLATRYLEGEDLSVQDISSGLKRAIASGEVIPVLFGAATSGTGIEELTDAIINLFPSPSEVAGKRAQEQGKADDPLAALVFKTSADPFVGKLSYFRVMAGTLKSDSHVWNSSEEVDERVGQVFVVTGKETQAVPELGPGDIGAVSKLNSVQTGHTLAEKDRPVTLNGAAFPTPIYHMAVHPTDKTDVDKLTTALARISEEDPTLVIERQPDTGELLVGGLGDTHVVVAMEKMNRKFAVDVDLAVPRIAYKETVRSTARAEHKHKKQSGGHGQYGHVWLEIGPMPRGTGFEFDARVVGGSVPKEYIPSVAKGVARAMDGGVLAGFPVVDVKTTLVDGSTHPVDSSGICFEIAASQAFHKAIRAADPILLEPIMTLTVTVPDDAAGDVMGDMNGRRGRIHGMVPQGDGTTVIEAEVPQAEVLQYATDLRSQTHGQGTFTMTEAKLEPVPDHLASRIVEAHEKEAVAV